MAISCRVIVYLVKSDEEFVCHLCLLFPFHLYSNLNAFTQYLNLTESSVLSAKSREPADIFTHLLRCKTKLGSLLSLFPSHCSLSCWQPLLIASSGEHTAHFSSSLPVWAFCMVTCLGTSFPANLKSVQFKQTAGREFAEGAVILILPNPIC